MGSIISKIDDDIDFYEFLCKKYNEKEKGVYSNHFYWLHNKHYHNTDISYEEYDKNQKIKDLNIKIDSIQQELIINKQKLSLLQEELKKYDSEQ